MITGTRELIRDVNVALVLDAVRRFGPISRTEVARRTGLGKSTVTGIVDRLLREDLVREAGAGTSEGSGRRPILLDLKSSSRFVVAVKLAPAAVTVALADLKGHLMPERAAPLPQGRGGRAGPAVLETLLRAIEESVDEACVPWERVMGIGVALPGVVDAATGTLVASHLLTWTNIPLKHVLEDRFRCAAVVDNDANAMALAEYWAGAGAGSRCLLGMTIGVGIGSGIVLDGRLFRGAFGGAGEIGHFPMDPSGPVCRCGRRGCLEAIAGDEAIARQARTRGSRAATREDVVRAAAEGDAVAMGVLEEAGQVIGRALATAVDLLSPDTVVVGGEATAQAGDLLLAPIQESVRQYAFSGLADRLRVVPAAVQGNAWLVGVAYEVLEALFKLPWGAVPGGRHAHADSTHSTSGR